VTSPGFRPCQFHSGGPLRAGVVLVRVDPVGGAVAGGVLAVLDRDAGGRAHAHRTEVAEPDPAGGEPLHRRGAVKLVQRMPLRLALGVGEERHGGVHDAHIVDEEHDEVRPGGRSRRERRDAGEEQQEGGKQVTHRRTGVQGTSSGIQRPSRTAGAVPEAGKEARTAVASLAASSRRVAACSARSARLVSSPGSRS